jgi:predicted transposase/invertase (TIGR01784 family)
MLSKFLNPKNDLAFKRIFGSEKNKDILIHFLNDIFARTTNPIEDVTFLKISQEPEIAAQRSSVLDVMCVDSEGVHFIVEVQVGRESGFIKRAQYYAAKTYIGQREKGIEYLNLKEVIFLAITNFTIFPDKKDYLSHHVILDKCTQEQDLKDFSFSFLELPKFKKKKSDLKSMTEKWAYFLKYAEATSEKDLPIIVGCDGIIQRAFDELNRYAWTPEELRAYDSIDMKQAADRDIMATEKAISKAEGEYNKAMIIAKNMLLEGLDISAIARMSGLSTAEIQLLAEMLMREQTKTTRN